MIIRENFVKKKISYFYFDMSEWKRYVEIIQRIFHKLFRFCASRNVYYMNSQMNYIHFFFLCELSSTKLHVFIKGTRIASQ